MVARDVAARVAPDGRPERRRGARPFADQRAARPSAARDASYGQHDASAEPPRGRRLAAPPERGFLLIATQRPIALLRANPAEDPSDELGAVLGDICATPYVRREDKH